MIKKADIIITFIVIIEIGPLEISVKVTDKMALINNLNVVFIAKFEPLN